MKKLAILLCLAPSLLAQGRPPEAAPAPAVQQLRLENARLRLQNAQLQMQILRLQAEIVQAEIARDQTDLAEQQARHPKDNPKKQ